MIPIWAALAAVGVFLLVMAPWWARQLLEFGTLSPSTASGKVLFIRDIGEWNDITMPATLDHLLGMGIGPLLIVPDRRIRRRGVHLPGAGLRRWSSPSPLALGAWARRHSTDFLPFFAYAILLFGFSGLVSAVHVPGGTFIHSAVALAPHSYILALEGVGVGVAWIATRRPAWRAIVATRLFTTAAIAFSVILAVVGVAERACDLDAASGRGEHGRRCVREGPGADDGPGDVDRCRRHEAMRRGWAAWSSSTTRSGRSLTWAIAYDIRWLVLDRTDGVASVAPILDSDQRPAWIGPPIYAERGTGTNPDGTPQAYSLAIFPVCLNSSTDPRCFSSP